MTHISTLTFQHPSSDYFQVSVHLHTIKDTVTLLEKKQYISSDQMLDIGGVEIFPFLVLIEQGSL